MLPYIAYMDPMGYECWLIRACKPPTITIQVLLTMIFAGFASTMKKGSKWAGHGWSANDRREHNI